MRCKEFDAAEHYIARILQDDPMFSDASQQRSIVLIQRGDELESPATCSESKMLRRLRVAARDADQGSSCIPGYREGMAITLIGRAKVRLRNG